MRTFVDAKAMAQSLRAALSTRQLSLTHSECLEVVAAQFGLDNWNVLSAKIEGQRRASAPQDGPRFQGTLPILRIFSVEKATEFYVDFLGFKIDWEHRFGDNFPLYAQVRAVA